MKRVKLKTSVSTPQGVYKGGDVLTMADPKAEALINNGAAELCESKPAAPAKVKAKAKTKAKGK